MGSATQNRITAATPKLWTRLTRLYERMKTMLACAVVCLAGIGLAQEQTSSAPPPAHAKKGPSAKHDVGSGAGDIGKGAAKGVGSAATGTGKAAVDLVTLHPIGAATDLGKGAAGTGKNVGVGAVKGTGKMLRGTGKAIRHLL